MSELGPVSETIPPFVLAAFIACVAGAGAFANCALLAAIFKCPKNGLFCIIVQLAIADCLLLGTSLWLELWFTNSKKWIFGQDSCIAYRGLSIFSSSASLYFIITIALHSLTTTSLEEKIVAQTNQRNDDDDEIRSSRHSLVANSDSSTPPRTMNVDYRIVSTKIAIALPCAFVWILSASLCVPELVLAGSATERNTAECNLVESSHKRYMYSLLSIFNLFLPLLILFTVGTLIISKLQHRKKLLRMNAVDSVAALKLSLSLIIIYCTFCAPRSLFYVYELHDSYDKVQVQQQYMSTNLILSAINLVACLLRPLLCIIVLPKLRKIFIFESKHAIDNV